MKYKLNTALFSCVMLIACGERAVYSENTENKQLLVTSTKPDRYGVVCYQVIRTTPALSCVQVVKGE